MKTFLKILLTTFLFTIVALAQSETKTGGRGQESGLIERINRNPKNHGIIDPQQRTIERTPKLINEPSLRRQTPKDHGVPIEGDDSGFCTIICSGDVIIVDNVYKPSFLELALESIENENFDGAIQFLNSAIEDEPFNDELYFLRGKAYLETFNYILAKTDFSTVNALNPQFADAFYYRGLTNLFLGDKQLAIEDFKIAASLGDISAEKFLLKYSN